jgi:site-specific DNA-cytosine methylase
VAGPSAVSRSPTGPAPVFALDKDADSCTTYEKNFGLAPEHASITDFEPPDLAGKLRDVDVMVGGPS